MSWVCSLCSGLSPLHGHGIWDWALTPRREGAELEQAITHVRAQPAGRTGILQGAPGVRYLKGEAVLSRDPPYRSAACCLSSRPFLPRGCSLSLLCSVTAGGRRKWEPPCLVPARAHCFGSGGVSAVQLLCLWLGRPESVSDGVSAEQPPSPGGLGRAHTHQQLSAAALPVRECGRGAGDSNFGLLVKTPNIHLAGCPLSKHSLSPPF